MPLLEGQHSYFAPLYSQGLACSFLYTGDITKVAGLNLVFVRTLNLTGNTHMEMKQSCWLTYSEGTGKQ